MVAIALPDMGGLKEIIVVVPLQAVKVASRYSPPRHGRVER